MSYYRGGARANSQRSANNSIDGQAGAKRKKPNRWPNKSKAREDGMGMKRDRRVSDNYDIDTPLFGTGFRNQARNFNFDDDRYLHDDDMYSYNDHSFDGPRYNRSPARSMRDVHRPNPSQQFEMRNRQPFVEPQHSGPAWQWEKYFNEIHYWQDKHKLSYYKSRCMALEFENQMLFEQVKTLIEENCVFAEERGEVPTMLLPNFPGGRKGFEAEKPATNKTSAGKPSTVGRSPKDKDKERKEAAKGKSGDNKEEEVKTEGPKLPRGFKRQEELEQLYGENVKTIQSLETSIQHNFNRNCDTYNPQMWMTEPLNPVAVV